MTSFSYICIVALLYNHGQHLAYGIITIVLCIITIVLCIIENALSYYREFILIKMKTLYYILEPCYMLLYGIRC